MKGTGQKIRGAANVAGGGSWRKLFVGVTPGLEGLLINELRSLPGLRTGKHSVNWHPHDGGVEGMVTNEEMWTIAWKLAESLRVRLHAAPFVSKNFKQFASQLKKLPWEDYLPPIDRGAQAPEDVWRCKGAGCMSGDVPAFSVLSERLVSWKQERVENRLKELYGLEAQPEDNDDDDDELPPMAPPTHDDVQDPYDEEQAHSNALASRFFVRIANDRVEVSVDASGVLLHRRGIRQHVSDAPLRETIAAACLRAAGWTRERLLEEHTPKVLWDPFAGSGTILLELPARKFAFELWRSHASSPYQSYVARLFSAPEDALAQAMKARGLIALGSDIDAKCIRSAEHNALLGGYDPASYSFVEGDFDEVEPRVPRGAVVVTNPPYGVRLLPRGQSLPALFRRFERMLVRRPDLTEVVVVNGYKDFQRCMKDTTWTVLHRFSNRGLPVQLLKLNQRIQR
ncbi:nucleic acid methylase [Acanthamoeba castellanii str. Neff]|uniref:Nucleic acid methylase n=1 Tax=Acanthamoeba castellanii (strain ATCC 30010 / Neff) TaxID=1257118 RepID=L8HCU2_ACACF|nr:nucleic acid methylase [Acanthamoeba castellanii str. Neff]ELR23010.1 nucleic acid methylase [Acanthamoeba castellanii str. Neff]